MTSAADIRSRFELIRECCATACRRCDRNPDEVTILGASKSQPIERLRWAWDAGLRHFGENRVQEAAAKMPQMPSDIVWHLIGPLQSNKVKRMVPLFDAVHSVDRLKIGRAIDREAVALGSDLEGFIEVNLAAETTKHGFPAEGLAAAIEPLANLKGLRIVGLMAIPPWEESPENSRQWFRQLRKLRDEICSRPEWASCPGYLSMGMSHDYEVAVEEGATHVRVGTSLFGQRRI